MLCADFVQLRGTRCSTAPILYLCSALLLVRVLCILIYGVGGPVSIQRDVTGRQPLKQAFKKFTKPFSFHLLRYTFMSAWDCLFKHPL